jgi:hypothetical protein
MWPPIMQVVLIASLWDVTYMIVLKRGRVFTKREREDLDAKIERDTLPFPFFSLELHQSCASGLIHKTTRKKRVDPQDT